MKIFALTLAVCLTLTTNVRAHDVWLTLDGKSSQRRAVVNYGHPGDRPPAFSEKIVDLVAVTETGARSLRDTLAVARQDGTIVVRSRPFKDDGHSLFAARYDNGFWSKTSNGFVNATRRSVPQSSETVWSGKFAKAVSGPDAPWSRELGHDLELIPLADPARMKIGGTLLLRVVFRGKPLAGAQVERGDGRTAMPEADIPRYKTDANGVAEVPIVKSGATLLVVDHRAAPSLAPDQADADLFNATIWFKAGSKD